MPHAAAPRIRSETLFQSGNKEVLIEHRGECYRLRLTRQDKLILNK
jgi:hemin uptake protein HemP